MKQLTLLTLLCLLLSACDLGRSQEVDPPTPVLLIPTVTSPPRQTAVPAQPSSLSAVAGTQVVWVHEGGTLMLNTWDGRQRELIRAHEIVELLWLSDSRHLLYVDQQEPTDPNDPPWPKHTLMVVDTETGEQWQLGTPAEDLHRIAFLPGERYVRAIAGSDWGDACFMNRRLIFVEVDQNYRRVALHDWRDFDSVLSDKPYVFFPKDVGEPVSDHEYEVSLTAYCLAGSGVSQEDLALISRYRLDLEAGTIVNVTELPLPTPDPDATPAG